MSDDDWDDITRWRHKGNPRSKEAFERARHTRQRDVEKIWVFVGKRLTYGATCDEICVELEGGEGIQTLSARCSEMKRDGLLVKTGVTRMTRKNSPADVLVTRAVWERYFAPPPAPEPAPEPSNNPPPTPAMAQPDLFE
jgi:hypothetical protein